LKDILPLKRLYIKTELKEQSLIKLSASNTHYISNVLRLREKQKLSIFNGSQGEWQGVIENLSKKKGLILVEKQIKEQEEENLINIIYAPIKGQRNYYLIEKITELGVSNIFPIISERSVIKKFNFRRANSCSIAASQQSGRLSVPKIHEFKNLKELFSIWNNNEEIIFCDETETKIFFNDIFNSKSKKKINTILIGPEGGFSLSEKNFLKNLDYVYGLSLGKRIFRADTAAISSLSLLINIKKK
jgi:16S rRNA (uracil1498-N3)-methyltransferase